MKDKKYNISKSATMFFKRKISLIVFLFAINAGLVAQDSTYLITSSMIYKNGFLMLPDMTEWRFKKGNDSAWASPKFDHSKWQKLDSTAIANIRLDKNGIFEAWFTIKLKLDSSLIGTPLFLYQSNSAATDIYINGQRFHSYGNNDYKGGNYISRRAIIDYPPAIAWPINQEILLAVHFTEFQGSLYRLKKNRRVLDDRSLLNLVNSDWYKGYQNVHLDYNLFDKIAITILAVLAALFWLIALFNRSQSHLVYMATTLTLLMSLPLLNVGSSLISQTSNAAFIFSVIMDPIGVAFFNSIIFLIASILEVRVHRFIKIYILINILATFFVFLYTELQLIIILSSLIPTFGICIYYLIKHRKKLKGPKAIVAVGVILAFLTTSVTGLFFQDNIDARYLLLSILPVSLLVYIAFWLREMIRNVEDKAQALVKVSNEKKEILENQKIVLEEQVQARTEELNSSLENLKSTQVQLIQSEKMASLGELTAGIAHEIQNPLNFVNNFSEVSNELVDEMNVEMDKGDIKEAKAISTEIKNNLEKINHHGKRADAIVKGMLQHSRKSEGKKALTDINVLCDEYLRLAYHGLRAKDKSFNAKFETNFDESVPKLNVVPQDIGRVVLNLINNAFYAVNEKAKQNVAGYESTVIVSTKKLNQNIEINVKDNGNGIPESIKEKIFQPFFTTKPTGSGTGLGLSLSYDIVKTHGGELKVETKEGEGSVFIVVLPK